MADHRNFRLLRGGDKGEPSEAERLDRFLNDLADPGVIHSLRREERRRQRLMLAAALILGLLLGAGGMLLILAFE